MFHLHSFPLRVIRYESSDGMSIANETFPYLIGVTNAAAGAVVVCVVCLFVLRLCPFAVFVAVCFCCFACRTGRMPAASHS